MVKSRYKASKEPYPPAEAETPLIDYTTTRPAERIKRE